MSETQKDETLAGKPTEQEMTEILARAMGMTLEFSKVHYTPVWWNPFTDRNVIAGIEERLSDEQRAWYEFHLERSLPIKDGLKGRAWAFRHASPAICAEALARTFEPGRFE